MEEKRDEQLLKYVCKLCHKRYPSGKSLGGHMRSHVISSSYKAKSKKTLNFRVENGVSSVISGDNNGYGLRENPKKTWRLKNLNTTVVTTNQDRVCKKCGKVFQSSKALCGHMSSHSNRERNFSRFKDEDDDEEDEDEDDWDSEEDDSFCSSNSSGFELEQEEVALCLMMLSRDSVQSKVGLNFSSESNSDNSSVILEGGSKRKMISSISKKKNCEELENSDSGYFENGSKELESDDSVDGYARNYEIKRQKFDYDPEFTSKSKKVRSRKYKCSIGEKRFKTHQALGGHIITHKRDIKSGYNGENSEKSVEISDFGSKQISIAKSVDENADKKKGLMGSKKTKGHCCPFCPKVFRSGQALGGHKRSHLIGCSSQTKASMIKSVEENEPENPNPRRFIDLNLPAPVEDDCNWQW